MSFHRANLHLVGAALVLGTAVFCAGCSVPEGRQPTDDHPVVVTVQAVPEAAAPGESVTLVVRFALAEGWHLYWAGRNDSGFPPRIDLELPPGWLAGGLQWPAPERHVAPGDILDHVYFNELVLIQKLGAPADAAVGHPVEIKAHIQWLACRDMCVPGRADFTVPLAVQARVDVPDPDLAAEAAARLPGPLPARTLEAAWEGATFHLHGPRARRLTFMPTDDCGPLVDLLQDGRGERLALRFKPQSDTVGPVRGLITMDFDGSPSVTYRLDYPAVLLETAAP